MIEVNLVPDVKQELIRAERVRSIVISFTILIGMIAIGLVIALSLWVFGFQKALHLIRDNSIKTESAKLAKVEDLESTLTIQNQLGALPALHGNKQIESRVFDVLATISPAPPNDVTISKLTINSADKTIAIEAQAVGGYSALEVFKKTIAATEFRYIGSDNNEEVHPLALSISDGDRSYGEDDQRNRVLRFSLTFQYPEQLFMPYLKDSRIVGPNRTNVTDSNLGLPKTLFSPKANDSEGGGE